METDAVNPITEETGAVGISEQGETISAADLYTPEENGASAQTDTNVQTDAPAQEDKSARMYTSDEMSDTVEKRLKQERRKAAYKLGRELLDEYMRLANITDENEALKQIREQRLKDKAARFKDDPQAAFEELLRARETREEPEDTPTSGGDAQRVYREIVQEINDGKVPKDFDIEGYLSDRERARKFLAWREKLGIEEACEIAMSMNPKPTKTEQNRALPKTFGTNNAYSPKKLDYRNMSTEEFRKVKEQIKRQSASGKRVEL